MSQIHNSKPDIGMPHAGQGYALRRSQGDFLQGSGQTGEQDADFADILSIFMHRYKAIIFGIVLCLVPAIVYIILAPKLYSATTSLLIDPRQGRSLGSDVLAGNLFSDTGQIESQIKLVSSQTVLKRVVASEKLLNDPEFGVVVPGLLSRMFSVLTGAAPTSSKASDLAATIEALSKAISVKRPERTYVIDIQLASQNAEKSARLANSVARAYMDDSVDARNTAVNFESEWVRDRLADIQEKLKVADARVHDYKQQNKFFDAGGKSVNDEQINSLSNEIITARAKTAEARARYDQIQKLLRGGKGLDTVVDAQKSTVLEKLRTQAADIARQEANLRATLGPRHPQYLEVQQQAQDTKTLISDEMKRIANSTSVDFQVAKEGEASLEKELERLRSISEANNVTRPKLRELERESEAHRAAFEKFSKMRDTIQQQGADSPIARIIAPASVPDFAYSPRKIPILALALAAGIGLGLALALMAESLSRKRHRFEPSRDVSARYKQSSDVGTSSTPHSRRWKFWQRKKPSTISNMDLGGTPQNKLKALNAETHIAGFSNQYSSRDMRMVIEDQNSDYYKSVAQLCSKILTRKPLTSTNPVFVILTSLEAGTGKTTLTSNLGLMAAAAGIRTLLIDTDAINARLSFHAIDNGKAGLISVLGRLRLAFQIKAKAPLYILPSSEGGQETSARFPKMLPQFLRGDIDANFDLVLIDGGVIHNNLLQSYCDMADQVLLIERSSQLDAAALSMAAQRLKVDPLVMSLIHIESPRFAQVA
jgi:polysaccharide biosynthesis transport protein